MPVNVPRPERFAWHKMLVSQLRHDTSEKRTKDIEQAAVLVAVLAERAPESLEQATSDLPRGALTKAMRGARAVLNRLSVTKHASAASVLRESSR